jgi:uncharacterized protein (DUF1786 family)
VVLAVVSDKEKRVVSGGAVLVSSVWAAVLSVVLEVSSGSLVVVSSGCCLSLESIEGDRVSAVLDGGGGRWCCW